MSIPVSADIEAAVARIPSMDGRQLAGHLRAAAAQVPEGSCIVEVGSWMGSGTAQLAIGAKAARPVPSIHVFDRFRASRSEVVKADTGGVQLRKGQNTLPIVQKHLAPLDASIVFHRTKIKDISWQDGPIGLYVDDAAKGAADFNRVLRCFGPSWIPGQTVLVLMDYGFWKKFTETDPEKSERMRPQYDFVTAHPDHFSVVAEDPIAGTSAAMFRYEKAFDFAALPVVEYRRRSVFQRVFGR